MQKQVQAENCGCADKAAAVAGQTSRTGCHRPTFGLAVEKWEWLSKDFAVADPHFHFHLVVVVGRRCIRIRVAGRRQHHPFEEELKVVVVGRRTFHQVVAVEDLHVDFLRTSHQHRLEVVSVPHHHYHLLPFCHLLQQALHV